MRSVEYIGKAERIRSREIEAETRINLLDQSIDRLSGKREDLQFTIQSIREEIRHLSDEEDDGLLSRLEYELRDNQIELKYTQQELVETQEQKELSQRELRDAIEERQTTLSEIQESARVHSRDLSTASGLFGSFAQIGSNLSKAFQGALGALSQAASILGGTVDIQAGTGGGGHRGSGSGLRSGFTSGISGGTTEGDNTYASRQISGANNLSGGISSAPVKVLPSFSSSQLSSQSCSIQSVLPSSGKREASLISTQAAGFTQTPTNLTNGLPPQKFMTTEEGRVRTDDNGKVHMYNKDGQWKLKPNCEYQSYGYYYRTDEKGRIMHVEGTLRLSDEGRKALNAKVEDMEKGDQRGHIIADMFGGSNKIDNIIPQLSEVNQGKYRTFEIELAKLLDSGKAVEVQYYVIYEDDSKRPSELCVRYFVDGKRQGPRRFPNNRR